MLEQLRLTSSPLALGYPQAALSLGELLPTIPALYPCQPQPLGLSHFIIFRPYACNIYFGQNLFPPFSHFSLKFCLIFHPFALVWAVTCCCSKNNFHVFGAMFFRVFSLVGYLVATGPRMIPALITP